MSSEFLQISHLKKVVTVSDVQMSPCGDEAVGVVKRVKSPSQYGSRLAVFAVGKKARYLTHSDTNARHPRFSPSGDKIAFVSKRGDSGEQLYLLPLMGGEAEPMTSFAHGNLSSFQWSPDGKKIALTYRPQPALRTKVAVEERAKRKESEPPITVTTWPYRLDGDGYPEETAYGLYLVDAVTGKAEMIPLETDSDEISYTWQDETRLILAYRVGKDRYMEPDDSELQQFNIKSKRLTKLPSVPVGSQFGLKVSPSGKSVVFGLNRVVDAKWGVRPDSIGVYNLSTGELRTHDLGGNVVLDGHPIGDSRDACAFEFFWSSDEERVYFAWALAGDQHIYSLAIHENQAKPVDLTPGFQGEVHVGSFDPVSATFGAWITTPTTLTEVAFFSADGIKVASRLNPWLKKLKLAKLTSFDLPCSGTEGEHFQGWRLSLDDSGNGKKRPAVISVHGGPRAMYSTAFFFEFQLLAAQGLHVYFCNPRGSTGYGFNFAKSIEGDWGNLDWADVKALTSHAKAAEDVDPHKVSVIGGSYGGFMVNWAISHSQEYYRAVTDRCVSNLLSKWGNSDYLNVPNAWWPGGAFYDSTVLWECSPIKHFANVTTPTLVVHSEGDLRCNIEQGEQVYAALKILGIETKFIRYPATTSHGMSRTGPPDLRMHRLAAYVAWLTQ